MTHSHLTQSNPAAAQATVLSRAIALLYGVVAYAVFFCTILYAIGFGEGLLVPKAIDDGAVGPLVPALIVNVLLMSVFAIQHSVMARQGFKRWWTRFVPKSIERSTYVLLASLALILLFWQWQPIPQVVWQVTDPMLATGIMGLSFFGWLLVLFSTFLINHFELFGLQQAWFNLRNRAAAAPRFHQPLLYKLVRHPLYLGFFVSLWIGPEMSVGRLVLAGGLSAWMLIAIQFEERDLIDVFGDQYRRYRMQVGMLLPRFGARG